LAITISLAGAPFRAVFFCRPLWSKADSLYTFSLSSSCPTLRFVAVRPLGLYLLRYVFFQYTYVVAERWDESGGGAISSSLSH